MDFTDLGGVPVNPKKKKPELDFTDLGGESRTLDFSDLGATPYKPKELGLPEQAVAKIKNLLDIFTPESLDPSVANVLDIARAPADVRSIDTPAIRRGVGSFAAGAAGSMAGMAGALPAAARAFKVEETPAGKVVSGAGQAAYDALAGFAREVAPEDPNFGDRVIQGAGSMATFLAPGLGAGKLAGAIPRMAVLGAKLGPAIGGTISTGLEAATEAGEVYQNVLRGKGSPEEAARAATKDFFANVILIGVTNRFGVFNDRVRGAVKRHLLGSSLEALQEGGQEILGAVAQGKGIDWGQVTEATGVGAVIGGGAAAIAGRVLPAPNEMGAVAPAAAPAAAPEANLPSMSEGMAAADGGVVGVKAAEGVEDVVVPRAPVATDPAAGAGVGRRVDPDAVVVPDAGVGEDLAEVRARPVEFKEAPGVAVKDERFKVEGKPVAPEAAERFLVRAEKKVEEKKVAAGEVGTKEVEDIRSEVDALGLLEADFRKTPMSPALNRGFVKERLGEVKGALGRFIEARIPRNQQEGLLGLLRVSNDLVGLKRVMERVEESAARVNVVPQTESTRGTINRVSGVAPARKQVALDEGVALRNQILAEARGAKAGFGAGVKEGKALTKEEMLERFRVGQQQVSDTMEFIKNSLPPAERGRFMAAAARATSLKRHYSIFARVVEEKEKIKAREAMGEIKDLARPSDKVPVDYQKRLEDVVRGYDLKRPSADTLNRLRSLKNFIDKNGEPLGISPKKVAALKRLSQKSLRDMSAGELEELRDELKSLQDLGRLKLELKYKYNARVRKRALDKLVGSTVNVDPVVGGSENAARAKAEALRYYMDTMHTMRVADMLDGYRGYVGENVRHLRELAVREDQSVLGHRNKMAEFMERAAKIKPTGEWSQEEMDAMAYHLYLDQGAYDQVQALIHAKGWKGAPKLSREMRRMMDLMREVVDRNAGGVAAVYEETQNKPFVKVKNYFPIKYEKEFNLVGPETIEQDRYRTTKAFRGFTFARKPGVKRVPRTDLFNVLDEALGEQEWYVNMQPKLEDLKYLVKSEEYGAAAGEVGKNFWANVLDVVSRRGWSATAKANFFLRQGRINLQRAILGYKLGSILMQPMAIFDAVGYVSASQGARAAGDVLAEFGRSWVNPRRAKEFVAGSPALQARGGGDESIIETFENAKRAGKFFRVYTEKGMELLQKADLMTAAGIERGVYNSMVRNGLPRDRALAEAEFVMNLVSGSNNVVYRPLILSKGEGARTWFTFQNFFLNKWGIIAHDLVKSRVVEGNYKQKVAAMVSLGILMAGAVAEQEARRNVYEFVSGKKGKPVSKLGEALMTVPFNVPFFGRILEVAYNKAQGGRMSSLPPVLKVFEDGLEGAAQAAMAKKKSGRVKGAMKAAESALSLGVGVPGTGQAFDLLDRLLAG